MKDARLEPGFLQAFRLFVATCILFWAIIGPTLVLVQAAPGMGAAGARAITPNVIENLKPANTSRMIAVDLLLMLLLMLPQLPRRLGRWFIPLTLLLALGPLLIGYYWWPSANPLQTPFVIFFFVLLVLIAWQYAFGHVLTYVLGLSVYQFLVTSAEPRLSLGAEVGWLVLQGTMMAIVGYVVVTLATVQREQRAALADAYHRQSAANLRLKQYAGALEELTISRERNRLARELHDTLAHSLSAVAVQLEAVRALWTANPAAARGLLDQADETARTGLTEARRALQALRASPLQDLGLVLALQELARKAAERSGATLELDLPPPASATLSPLFEQGLYRIAQEALENTVRHALARHISVRLATTAGFWTLSIEDDGLGLEAEPSEQAEGEGDGGWGIRGMQERAELIGGELQIESERGRGTQVRVTVPQ